MDKVFLTQSKQSKRNEPQRELVVIILCVS